MQAQRAETDLLAGSTALPRLCGSAGSGTDRYAADLPRARAVDPTGPARRLAAGAGAPATPEAGRPVTEGPTVGSPPGRHRAGAERPEHRPVTHAEVDLDDDEIEERNAAGSGTTSPCAYRHPGGPDDYIRFSRSLVGA
jgi:hypothetical protein